MSDKIDFEAYEQAYSQPGVVAQERTSSPDVDTALIPFAPLKTKKRKSKARPKLTPKQKEAKKVKQARIRKQLAVRSMPTAVKDIVSFDVEFRQDGDDNGVISYQYVYSVLKDGVYVRCKGIFFTKSGDKKDRLSLECFLSKVIVAAMNENVIDKWPEHISLVAHFLKADLSTFSNFFKDIKTEVNSVRKTFASLKDAYGVDMKKEFKKRIDDKDLKVKLKGHSKFPLMITFYDTMLFAPAGYQSLAKVGQLVGYPKKDILYPYSIERMDEYLIGDRAGFIEYAIADAMIACLHFEKVVQYECIEQGNANLSGTISGLAKKDFKKSLLAGYQNEIGSSEPVKLSDKGFKRYFNSLFSKESVTSELWKQQPDGKPKPLTVTETVYNEVAHIFKAFAVECYHGGRNECYMTGPSYVRSWYDYDVPSCYTVILNGLRPLDFDNLVFTLEESDYMGDVLGLARVKFKFPPDTPYPSLPVKVNKFGLVYPLEGVSYCTAAELEVARHQNATIDILQGIVIPWLDAEDRLFTPLMKTVRAKRQFYKYEEKNDFLEKFWKEKGNSIYGHLGMGLGAKRVFDIQVGYSKDLKPGELAHAYYAAYVTGTARALLSALLIGVPKDKTVISLTTDGFLTDATVDEIDKSLPICERFREWFHMIEPKGGDILEEKHRMEQVLAFKNRGQTTSKHDADPSYKGVNARAGIQEPSSLVGGLARIAFMVDSYVGREPDSAHESTTLTPTRQMGIYDKDMVSEKHLQHMGLEPDYKRDLVPVGMVDVANTSHIQCTSVPHRTVADMVLKRTCFDNWTENNCLKTMDDWVNWQEYFKLNVSLKNTPLRIQKGEASDQLFQRIFLRVWGQELCSVNRDMKQSEFVRWFNTLDGDAYQTNPSAVSSSSNAEKSKVYFGVMPVTNPIVKLLKLLLVQYPNFEYEQLFIPAEVAELRRLMAS